MNGEQLIEIICKKIRFEHGLCYDSNIIYELRRMTHSQLNEALTFGDVIKWKNERNNIKLNP